MRNWDRVFPLQKKFSTKNCPSKCHRLNHLSDILLNVLAFSCEHKTNLVYDRMKRQLLRIKNSHYPCIPKTIEEIRNAFENTDLRAEFGLNSHKSHPLYFGTVVKTNFSFITFASVKYIERFDAEKSAKRQFEKNLHVSNKVHPYMIECKNRQRNKYVIGDNDYSMTVRINNFSYL